VRRAIALPSLAVALAMALCAAPASADTVFEVDTLVDQGNLGGCVNISSSCSLRDAIERANEIPGEDEIEFSKIISGTIEIDEGLLPAITGQVTIDATTAAGYAGAPVIGIDGQESENEGGETVGFRVAGSGLARIEGFAVFGFDLGFELGGTAGSVLCENYVGLDPTGSAIPNGTGVEVLGGSTGNQIGGSGCFSGQNVISGNDEWGVVVLGESTSIKANRIGVAASGDAGLGNGLGGVLVGAAALGTTVGNFQVGEGEQGPGNVIAHNGGPGVLVEDGDRLTAIYGNSIFANDGLGIEIEADDPPRPQVSAVEGGATTTIGGGLTGEPDGDYYLDFYASASCDPSGSGEGQTYLGSKLVEADAGGSLSFSAGGLKALPADQTVITATATELSGEGDESTSEFSQCFVYSPPGPPAGPPAPPNTPILSEEPVNGESVAVAPVSGTVKVKAPGKGKFTILKEGQTIPVGSLVDATNGKVTLTSVNAAGEEQTAVFYGGKFLVAQHEGSGLVILKLRGGNFSACKGGARGSAAQASARSGRRLWGSGKGKFRTEGSYGSATVRGTVWLTEDRCNGTLFKVRRGVVSVRDFVAGTTFPLGAGKSYFASKSG